MPACIVKRVVSVAPHSVPGQPERSRDDLNIVLTDDGTQFVSQMIAKDTPRYKEGDLVVHIPHGARLPPALQERLGARDARIRAGNFSGVRSNGMLMPAGEARPGAAEGDDVTGDLGVTF